MEEEQSIFIPFLSSSSSSIATTSSIATGTSTSLDDCEDHNYAATGDYDTFLSGFGIILRMVAIIFVGAVSVWAHHQDSKGFRLTIINDAKDSPAGQHFNLFYVSNDEATRVVLNASALVENILYPHNSITQNKKLIRHVTLNLAAHNLTNRLHMVVSTIKRHQDGDDFVITLSPSIMGEPDSRTSVKYAIQRAMARVWLWDGESRAPPMLLEGIVDHICRLAGYGYGGRMMMIRSSGTATGTGDLCLEDVEDIRWLNDALRKEWDDDSNSMVGNELCKLGKTKKSVTNMVMVLRN